MNKVRFFLRLSFITLCVLQCKKLDSQTQKVNNKTTNNSELSGKNKELSCNDLVKKIVESSNLELKQYKNSYTVNIESIKSDSINVHVYTENNLSDKQNEKQMVESTIAWLIFLPNEQKLLNITADPSSPTELKFDKSILKNNDIFKNCQISKISNKSSSITSGKIEKNCKKISREMMSGEECILKNIQIKNGYNDIIKNKLVDDFDFLLKTLPKENQSIEINKNGLITIDYTINPQKIDISMTYEGGVTEIILEQMGTNLKRKIQYNAD